jgi:hypothetical protein
LTYPLIIEELRPEDTPRGGTVRRKFVEADKSFA